MRAKIPKIINNSAGDCSISLKFRTDFQGQRVKSQGQGHRVTTYQHQKTLINCRISKLLKNFHTAKRYTLHSIQGL